MEGDNPRCELKLDDILHDVRKEKDELFGYIKESECSLDEFVRILNRKGICFSKRTSKRLKGLVYNGFSKEKLISTGVGTLYSKQQSITFTCAYGHRYYKIKEDLSLSEEPSPPPTNRRSKTNQTRNRIIATRKLECPAILDVLKITVYPEYKTSQELNWRTKSKNLKKFKEDVASKPVLQENRYYISLSTTHNHPIVSLLHHKIDDSLRSEIQRLVGLGITKITDVRQHLTEFVARNFPEAPSTSLAFYPKKKTIDNYVRKFKRMQENPSAADRTEHDDELYDSIEVMEQIENDCEITEHVIDDTLVQVVGNGVVEGQILDPGTGQIIDAIVDLTAIQDQLPAHFEVVETAKENIENGAINVNETDIDKKIIARFRNQLRRLLHMSQCIKRNANLDNLMNCQEQLVLVEKLLSSEIIKESGVQQVLSTSRSPPKKKKRNSGDIVMKY